MVEHTETIAVPGLAKAKNYGYGCPGHSACLPTGHMDRDGFVYGAMPDNFAKLDFWD